MLADKLILQPSRKFIDPELRRREWIQTTQGKIEAWVTRSMEGREQDPVDVVAIKFPGTAGRAERGGPHPFDLWSDQLTEIWTINHAGYGGSEGKARLQRFPAACDAIWEHVTRRYPDIPVVLVGNSLGCTSALYLSARHRPAGIVLRNPVPLHQLISKHARYNWWNFGMARLIAKQIPTELDSVINAGRSSCPAFFIRSENDQLISQKYQAMIFDAYAGEKSEFVIAAGEHHSPIPESQTADYRRQVQALSEWVHF